MAIKSTFYDTAPGEGVKETTWAQSAPSRGVLYGVAGAGDLNLTAHATTPYAVNLSAGKFWGQGIWDEATGSSLVQSVTPANGAIRWDLIAVRRDWQPTGGGPTSFVSIQGGGSAAIPGSRENRPGVVDDQPLYLVQWKGGQTQPQQIIDLRCWAANGGVEIADKLALGYLAAPGAAVKLGKTVWRYELQANGVWEWSGDSSSRADLIWSQGWDVQGEVSRDQASTSTASRCRMGLRLKRIGGAFSVSAGGGFVGLTGAIVPAEFRPKEPVDVVVSLTEGAANYGGVGVLRIGTGGQVSYLPTQPTTQSIKTNSHFNATAEWFK